VGWLLFALASLLILSGVWLYTGWVSSQRVLPPGLVVAGLPVGGMTREQALNTFAEAYALPITVRYQDEEILLVPEMVDLSLDVEATSANLDQILMAQAGLRGFINYTLDIVLQREYESPEVRPILTYSRERLDAFLRRTAQQHDHPPLDPVPLPEAGTFRPPQPGTALNIEDSRPLLVETMLSPTHHEVTLAVEVDPVPPASVELLRQALDGRLEEFAGVASIFVKDLETGRELCYNCNVAFAGLSTLKIGVALNLYRHLDAEPGPELQAYLDASLMESDNAATNLILAEIGDGDPYEGVVEVTAFLQELGLTNTFIAAPYDLQENVDPPDVVTAANSREDVTTDPDPYIQTTALDMGLLLEGLAQCAERGGGTLRLLYPRRITPAECEEVLRRLQGNQVPAPVVGKIPPGTPVLHKQGWADDTHSDVALVQGPEGTFILSVFLHQPEWLIWEESAPLFADIGQLAYRFFNPS
jgi:beta-lactamase class A